MRLYPKSGYYADGLTVTDRLGHQIDAYYEGNDRYTFTLPVSLKVVRPDWADTSHPWSLA